MMTLANYGIGSSKNKDPNSAKVLSKSLQIRNRAETALKQCLKSHHKLTAEKRNEVLSMTKDYYSRIPFNLIIWNKYQTKQCIVDSILLLDSEFDPVKAIEAFKQVEKMLTNLIHLPWHKEFRKIFTYSGYYRLYISSPLIGIEEVFKAAGFQESRDSPYHLELPDDKMPQVDDGEAVTGVLFDCLLAQVVLSDIVNVYENCCKQANKTLSLDERLTTMNQYSWIQAYFRERSTQITDRACSTIQGLLGNITNLMSKFGHSKQSAAKNISFERRNELLVGDDQSDHGSNQSPAGKRARDTASKMTVREKTRKFLAQQSYEDENSLKLSSDLLRLPANIEAGRRLANSPIVTNGKPANYSQDSQRVSIQAADLGDQRLANSVNNGYQSIHNGHTYYRSGSDHLSKFQDSFESVPRPAEQRLNSEASMNHQIHVDSPHDDREPLLTKYERRPASEIVRRNARYDSRPTEPSTQTIRSTWRDIDDDHLMTVQASHLESSFPVNHNPVKNNSNSSKYSLNNIGNNQAPQRKYESRDIDSKLINRRSQWSCGSCTYNNHIDSEICEMCRNRRQSR